MFVNPRNILEQADLIPGMKIADFGAGSGHYSLAAAKIVGETGHVYALEIKKEVVSSVAREARHHHIRNLDALWVDLEKPNGSHLQSSSIDCVLLINVLFQISAAGRRNVVSEIARVLRPQGRVVFVDWSDSGRGVGPAGEAAFAEPAAEAFFEKCGFVVNRKINAGAHHYGFILKKGVE